MPYLIEKEVYKKDNRKGNPLRTDIRKLKEFNKLDLIEYLDMVDKTISKGDKKKHHVLFMDSENYVRDLFDMVLK